MSASNKSWIMVGGLALVGAGVIYATKQMKGTPAPPAEIAPAVPLEDTNEDAHTRTHFPTILRAKPVTEPTSSPRYAPRDASGPSYNQRFSRQDTEGFTTPVGVSPARSVPAVDTGSPAFRVPTATESKPSRSEEVAPNAADRASVAMPTTYVTVAKDSFWQISKRQYGGEGRYFKALFYHNRNKIERPDLIPAGIEIETPPLAELQRLYPDLCRVGQRN